MKLFGINILFLCIFATLCFASKPLGSINRSSSNKITLHFSNYVGDQILTLDTLIYMNDLGQMFKVSKFKYYISNIKLTKTNGEKISVNNYFLIDEDKQDSKNLVIDNIPLGDYNGITFIVGVDSLHNCSGIQSGALDPLNGMFWAWNTGYIFLKLEGFAPESKSTANLLEYHIGGFQKPCNAIREIHLQKKVPISVSEKTLAHFTIKMDASEILKTPTTIDFSVISSVTDFQNACTIADNYTNAFSLIETTDK